MNVRASLRTAVCEESSLVRALLRLVLARSMITVVAEAAEPRALVALCASERPATVLIGVGDTSPPFEEIEEIASMGSAILLLVDRPSDSAALRSLAAGASGLLDRDTDADSLVRALLALGRGEAPLCGTAAGALLRDWRSKDNSAARHDLVRPTLSRRELGVLWAMRAGRTTAGIAELLGISPKTVEAHKTRIFSKLGAKSQAHAITLATARGLFDETIADFAR